MIKGTHVLRGHDIYTKPTSKGNDRQHQSDPKSDRFQEKDLSDQIPVITAEEERRMKLFNKLDSIRGQLRASEERNKKLQAELRTRGVTQTQLRENTARKHERPKSAYPIDRRVQRQLKALEEDKKKLQDDLIQKQITIIQLREDARRHERPKSAYPTDHIDKRQIKALEEENKELQAELNKKKITIQQLLQDTDRESERQSNEIDALKRKMKHCDHLITSLKEEKINNETTIIGLKNENKQLLNRLSRIASDRLAHENTDIPYLSDATRPSKLTEKMSDLYDNQWTSAFDEFIAAGFDNKTAIYILLNILMETNEVCKTMTFSHFQKLQDACTCFEYSSSAYPQNKEKRKIVMTGNANIEMQQGIISIWHESSRNVLAKVIWIIMENVAEKFDITLLQMTQTPLYMSECAELCWMMNVQERPMYLDVSVPDKDGNTFFDTEKFRSYTRTGQHIDFVVWPALYLFEGGSLLKQGVAQGL